MNVIHMSQSLIVAFVGSVTLWYFVTPYIVRPHPGIIDDVLSKSTLLSLPPKPSPSSAGSSEGDFISIENWTKWRVYVNEDPDDKSNSKDQSMPKVLYGRTGDNFRSLKKAVMNMEWRSEYQIKLEQAEDSKEVSVKIDAPSSSWHRWGIYNHFDTIVSGRTVRIVPRFLFGLPVEVIESIYGGHDLTRLGKSYSEITEADLEKDIVAKLPIVGLFSESPTYDRIIIQSYMNIVTLSVIFLLWANNPPESLNKSSAAAK